MSREPQRPAETPFESLQSLVRYFVQFVFEERTFLSLLLAAFVAVSFAYPYPDIAMWVGFVIIIFGIVSYILPFSLVNEDLRGGNFQILTIGSGVVIELVSALFLFIFRSSTNQLTYFYNRQIFIHNALLSYKMATTMSDPDTAKKMIIEKILDLVVRLR